MLRLSAEAIDIAVRLHGMAQPVGGVLWPAWGSLLHQRLGRLGSYRTLPRLGVKSVLVSGTKRKKRKHKKRKHLQGWPESQPSGDPERQAWLFCVTGESSTMQLVVLTAAETSLLQVRFFHLLPGRRAEGKSVLVFDQF